MLKIVFFKIKNKVSIGVKTTKKTNYSISNLILKIV